MKDQFLYTRKVKIPPKEGETEPQYKLYTDSFNINKVIRTVEIEENQLLVLLDDFHQRKEQIPVYSNKGRQTGTKSETGTFQSEIYLTETEDIQRFRELFGV